MGRPRLYCGLACRQVAAGHRKSNPSPKPARRRKKATKKARVLKQGLAARQTIGKADFDGRNKTSMVPFPRRDEVLPVDMGNGRVLPIRAHECCVDRHELPRSTAIFVVEYKDLREESDVDEVMRLLASEQPEFLSYLGLPEGLFAERKVLGRYRDQRTRSVVPYMVVPGYQTGDSLNADLDLLSYVRIGNSDVPLVVYDAKMLTEKNDLLGQARNLDRLLNLLPARRAYAHVRYEHAAEVARLAALGSDETRMMNAAEYALVRELHAVPLIVHGYADEKVIRGYRLDTTATRVVATFEVLVDAYGA